MFIFNNSGNTTGSRLAYKDKNGNTYTADDNKLFFYRYNRSLPKINKICYVANNDCFKVGCSRGRENPLNGQQTACVYDPVTMYAHDFMVIKNNRVILTEQGFPLPDSFYKDNLSLGDFGIAKNGDYYMDKLVDDGMNVIDMFRQSFLSFTPINNYSRNGISKVSVSITITLSKVTSNTTFLAWRPEDVRTGLTGSPNTAIVSVCNRNNKLGLYVRTLFSPMTENVYTVGNKTLEANKKINITLIYNAGNIKAYYNGELIGETTINIPSYGDMAVGGTGFGVTSEVFPNGTSSGTIISYPLILHSIYSWADVLTTNDIKQIMRYDGII